MSLTYQQLLEEIELKLRDRLDERKVQLKTLRYALDAREGLEQPTPLELMARAKLATLNRQIVRLSRTLENMASASRDGDDQ